MTSFRPQRVEPGFDDFAAEDASALTVVDAALNACISGQGTIREVREAIVEALYDKLEYADPIIAMIGDAHAAGKLSPPLHRQLLRDVGRLTTEEMSTDVMHDATAGSGEKRRPVGERYQPAGDLAGARAPTSTPDTPAAGSVLLDRFELLECVADDGMGRVFRARDRVKEAAGHPDALIAIKLLRPASSDSLQSLQKEALLAQSLNHPNIVNVFDLCRDAGQHFITMEWLDGQSLADRLDAMRGRPLPAEEAAHILHGLTAALTFAHHKKIVHGDIKPGNVYLTDEGDVKLLDFGMSRRFGGEPSLDSDSVRAFTRAYASCEVLEGNLPDVRDDIYSLCCLWYRLITGVRPFGARDSLQAERDQARVKEPPGLSRRQWQVLRAGLSFRRARRPKDVTALTRILFRKKRRATKVGQRAAVLLFVGVLGAALWRYWPQLTAWLTDARPVARVSGFPDADRAPATGGPEERVESAPGLATADEMPSIAEVPANLPPAANTDIVAGAPAEGIPVVEPSANAAAEDTRQFLGEPPAEAETLPQPDPVQAAAAVESIARQLGDAAPADAPIAAPPGNAAPAVTPRYAPLGFRQNQYVVTESDVAVMLEIGYPRNLAAPVSLSVIIEPGTAVPYEDFMPPSTQSVVVGPGEAAAKILVPLISDSVDEHTEEFLVRLASDDPALQIDWPETVVIILDDDGPANLQPIDEYADVQDESE